MSQNLIPSSCKVVVIGVPTEVEQRAVGQPTIGVPRVLARCRFKGAGRDFSPAQSVMLDVVDSFEFENGDRALAKEEDQPEPPPRQDRSKAEGRSDSNILEHSIPDMKCRPAFAP